MSKQTVLITSALYSSYGIYKPEERIKQTLETAISARKYIPDATIILIDNSTTAVQNEDGKDFNDLLDIVDYYIDNSDDPDIKHFHENVSNYDIGKNSMEVLGLLKSLAYIQSNQEIMDAINASNRIFKLSGRYVLTDKFDINKFDNADTKGKYVFKKRQAAWCDKNVTGVEFLLQTRLWSFTPELYIGTIGLFESILQNMFSTFNQNAYIDVEHSMAKFIKPELLVELDTVGLQGNIAPNGMMIID